MVGPPFLKVVGSATTPKHCDGTPVITYRLWSNMTAWERVVYTSTHELRTLSQRAAFLTRGNTVAGVDADDLVQYAMELQGRYGPDAPIGVLVAWMRQEFRRRKQEDSTTQDLRAREDSIEYVADCIPDEVVQWVRIHVPGPSALAVLALAEVGCTLKEAAARGGITPRKLRGILDHLKDVMARDDSS